MKHKNKTAITAISIVLTLSIPLIMIGSAQVEISNPLPADGATGECPCCITLSVDISNVSAYDTNLTFYSNLSGDWDYFYIGIDNITFTNITNATYAINVPFFNQYNHIYYWNVSVSDGANVTYTFTTALNKAECDTVISNESWVVGVAIMFGGLGIILAIRKRRNRYER